MPILDDRTKNQLRERLTGGLPNPVELKLYRSAGSGRLILPEGLGCQTCDSAEELARDLVEAASGSILLEVFDVTATPDPTIHQVPSLTVGRPGEEHRITFQGLPAGYEFSTLLDAVERVSTGDADLSPADVEQLSKLDEPLEVMVFVTPSCPYCPGAAAMGTRLAVALPQVRSLVIEANEFPALSQEFGVQGVPQTVINRSGSFVGALPPGAFIERVMELAAGATVAG